MNELKGRLTFAFKYILLIFLIRLLRTITELEKFASRIIGVPPSRFSLDLRYASNRPPDIRIPVVTEISKKFLEKDPNLNFRTRTRRQMRWRRSYARAMPHGIHTRHYITRVHYTRGVCEAQSSVPLRPPSANRNRDDWMLRRKWHRRESPRSLQRLRRGKWHSYLQNFSRGICGMRNSALRDKRLKE